MTEGDAHVEGGENGASRYRDRDLLLISKNNNKELLQGGKVTAHTVFASEFPSTTRVLSLRPRSCTPRRSGAPDPSLSSKPLFHARSPSNPGAPLAGTNGDAAKGEPCVISARVSTGRVGGLAGGGGPR